MRESSLLDFQIVFFLQIELALGMQSAITVGWKKRDENVSAAGGLKVQ